MESPSPDIGELNERIRIVRLREAFDARSGQPKPSAEVVIDGAWAKWIPLPGRETDSEPEQLAVATDEFRIRYRPGIGPTMQVEHRGRTLPIASVREIKRKTFLSIVCVGAA